jgi:hypothetical protein
LRKVIDRVRQRYGLPIPSKVLMADYDDKEGDLYLRFREARTTEGDPTNDGLVIVHRERNRIAAIEILNLAEL